LSILSQLIALATLNRLVKTIFTGNYVQEEKNSAVEFRFMFSSRLYLFVGEVRRTTKQPREIIGLSFVGARNRFRSELPTSD
jgi:hypothetical protein